MSSPLLEAASRFLAPDLLSRASTLLGESETGVANALTRGALPALLASLAVRSQDPGGAERIGALLRDPALDPRALQHVASPSLASLFGESGAGTGMRQLGEKLLVLLFDGRVESLASALADLAGIRPSSALSLLRLAAPLVLGVVGERARHEGLEGASLGRLFAGERDDLVRALPPPLRTAIGLPARADAAAPGRSGATRWVAAALALLALALTWSLLPRDREPPHVAATQPAAPLPAVSAPSPIVTWVSRRLPNGTEIHIPDQGIEIRLIGLLEGGGASDEWIEFDRLLFETNSARLKPESQDQLRNVAAILAAYPNAHVGIGGYTDNRGDPASNLKLSQERALNVESSLVALGISADRLEAEGYGEQHPLASNATDEGRTRNRRIALRVTGS